MIKVIYNKVCGRCVQSEPLTSGMVGQPIHFEYSHDFDGLAVTAVFTDGKNTVDVVNPGNECVIPHEVLTTVGAMVKVGIYAVRGNELVIPTVYAAVGIVLKGADPSGDVSIDPTLPIWAQIQALIGDLADLETEAKNNLVSAINEAAQTGSGGASIAMRVEGGYIQYTVDGKTWSNLIAVADLKGQQGDPGKDGAPGKDGKDGTNGITPHIGENGNWYIGNTDTGKPSRGEQGVKGDKGDKGADGATGAKGDKGDAFTYSDFTAEQLAALKGEKGDTGAIGPQGPKGDTGPQGPTGATGAQGPAGADGKSAYAYAVEGGYAGTEEEFTAKLVEEIPTALPNPNALTFTGAVTGSYDGSAPLSVEIPSGGGSSGGSTAEWQLLGTYTMLVSDRSLVIDLSQFGGITHFRIIGNFPKCSEKCDSIYIYLGTAFNHINQLSQMQNVYAFNLLAECELFDGQLYGFIGVADGWTMKPIASVVINTPRDSGKNTSFKIYYNKAVNDTTENTIQIWGY